LVCLIVALAWCYRIKPLEHMEQGTPENVSVPPKAKRAV